MQVNMSLTSVTVDQLQTLSTIRATPPAVSLIVGTIVQAVLLDQPKADEGPRKGGAKSHMHSFAHSRAFVCTDLHFNTGCYSHS